MFNRKKTYPIMVARFTKLLLALVLVSASIPLGAMPAQAAGGVDGMFNFTVNGDNATDTLSTAQKTWSFPNRSRMASAYTMSLPSVAPRFSTEV